MRPIQIHIVSGPSRVNAIAFIILVLSTMSAQADTPKTQSLELNVLLRQWYVMGPFPKDSENSTGLDEEYFPREATLKAGSVRIHENRVFQWKSVDSTVIEFRQEFNQWNDGGNNVVAYAYTEFISPVEQELLLAVASDDEVLGWLNGKEVIRGEERSAATIDATMSRVALKSGINRLLLKVGQGTDWWEVSARFRPLEIDEPLVTFRCLPTGRPGRYPPVKITLLDDQDRELGSHRCGALRTGTTAEQRGHYALYAPMPETQPARIRLTATPSGMVPINDVYSWAEFQNNDIVVHLKANGPAELRILEARTNEPVEGARTFAEAVGMSVESADDKGRLSVSGVSPIQWRMFVAAKGFNTKVFYPAWPHGPIQTVKLNRGGKILKGQIISADGNPIAGATIDTGYDHNQPNGYQPTVTTDADGNFEVWGLMKKRTTLTPTITCDGYVTRNNIRENLNSQGPTDVTWTLYPAATVTGVVVSEETGKPIANVTITTGTSRFGSDNLKTTTNKDGQFKLSQINPGTSFVHAFSDDFAPAVQSVTARYGVSAVANFELEAGQPVTGIVKDSDGNPMEQVWLLTDTWNGQRMFRRETYTDHLGQFTLDHMPATEAEIHVIKKGYMSLREVVAKGGDTLDLKIRPVITHTITIRDAATKSLVPGLQINRGYQYEGRSEISWQSGSAGNGYLDKATGTMKIVGSESDRYSMAWRFQAPGYSYETVILPNDAMEGQSFDVNMKVSEPLSGIVVDADTRLPAQGVVVAMVSQEDRLQSRYLEYQSLWSYLENRNFTGQSATTDSAGRFRLSKPSTPEKAALAVVSQNGFALVGKIDALLKDAGKDQQLILGLPKPCSLRGRLTRAGNPVDQAAIYLQRINVAPDSDIDFSRGDDEHNWLLVSGRLKTNANGEFDFGGLGAGRYQLYRSFTYDHPNGGSSQQLYLTSQIVELKPDQKLFHEITLPAGQTVKGQAFNSAGESAPNCLVILSNSDGPERYDATKTDADGTFRFSEIPPGEWQITVQHFQSDERYSYRPDASGTETVVVADKTATVDVILKNVELK